ncbi:hypothetical protein PPERSA_02922 [Pseudocohnilembus persalinus]|uniref:VTT domain-containing protein n=1 Tax=Pseudocohnilembus persalinus TaxID=266149 RepID=A0A0V0R6S0_PSEPJ|nr:hypothetical protein PPERSA_02922 [Pseudocohnilembus persalinus]|eukprot:KRX10183.1 hypothetical protein PPERSA_02922 [Pseudocohnilembus persalinus]
MIKPIGDEQTVTDSEKPTIFNINREKLLQITFSVGPIIMMIIVLILFQFDDGLKLTMIQYFSSMNTLNFYTISVVLGIGIALVLISAPYLLFEMCLGYTFNYFLALAFSVFAKFLGETVCFVITKYLLKEYFLNIFQKNEFFKVLDKAVEQHPWKIQHIMRSNALMPLFIINFGSGLLKVTYIQFIFPAVLWGTVYSSISVYGGSQIHSVEELLNHHAKQSPKSDSQKIVEYFEITVLILSLLLIVVVIHFSKLYFQKIRDQMKQEEFEKQQQEVHTNQFALQQ